MYPKYELLESIQLAKQAKEELKKANHRYITALQECLPTGTSIRFVAHNGRTYDGVIISPVRHTGYIMVQNIHTQKSYEINVAYIEGL